MIVAMDGSGDFKSIQEAVDSIPEDNSERIIIYIKKGVFKEKLKISKPSITLIGEDRDQTILTYDDSAYKLMPDGQKMGTFRSYSTFIGGKDFIAENITFENSAGKGSIVGQAVAVYVNADRTTFRNCRLLGNQDTLFMGPLPRERQFEELMDYSQDKPIRQYYENCYIRGDIDFIFGSSTAVFNNCTIHSNNINSEINGYITAPSTPESVKYGFVFINCKLTSEVESGTVFLGRPWRDYGRAVFINCCMGEHIKESGWDNWAKPEREKTSYFAEYNSKGPGAKMGERVGWIHILTDDEAREYTIEGILSGEDKWNPFIS